MRSPVSIRTAPARARARASVSAYAVISAVRRMSVRSQPRTRIPPLREASTSSRPLPANVSSRVSQWTARSRVAEEAIPAGGVGLGAGLSETGYGRGGQGDGQEGGATHGDLRLLLTGFSRVAFTTLAPGLKVPGLHVGRPFQGRHIPMASRLTVLCWVVLTVGVARAVVGADLRRRHVVQFRAAAGRRGAQVERRRRGCGGFGGHRLRSAVWLDFHRIGFRGNRSKPSGPRLGCRRNGSTDDPRQSTPPVSRRDGGVRAASGQRVGRRRRSRDARMDRSQCRGPDGRALRSVGVRYMPDGAAARDPLTHAAESRPRSA